MASNPAGEAALVAVVIGFVVFGATRLWSAWNDRRSSRWRRATTGLQGAFYVVLGLDPDVHVLGKPPDRKQPVATPHCW